MMLYDPLAAATPDDIPLAPRAPGTFRIIELAKGQCRYPFGEGPFTFCGVECGATYCAEHYRMTHYHSREVT